MTSIGKTCRKSKSGSRVFHPHLALGMCIGWSNNMATSFEYPWWGTQTLVSDPNLDKQGRLHTLNSSKSLVCVRERACADLVRPPPTTAFWENGQALKFGYACLSDHNKPMSVPDPAKKGALLPAHLVSPLRTIFTALTTTGPGRSINRVRLHA